MAQITVEKIPVASVTPQDDGKVGAFACDDGLVRIIAEFHGNRIMIAMEPDEMDGFAVAAIRMASLARTIPKPDITPRIEVPSASLPPDIKRLLISGN